MLSRESRREARKRGSARRQIDFNDLVIQQPPILYNDIPKSPETPKTPKTIRKSPRIAKRTIEKSPMTGLPTTPRIRKSTLVSEPNTPELSSFISPIKPESNSPSPAATPETPIMRAETDKKSTPVKTLKKKPLTPKISKLSSTTSFYEHSNATGNNSKTVSQLKKKISPKSPKRILKKTPVRTQKKPTTNTTPITELPVESDNGDENNKVSGEIITRTSGKPKKVSRPRKSGQSPVITIKYTRLSTNKTKLTTVDVLNQVLTDYFSGPPPPPSSSFNKKTVNQLINFQKNYKEKIDSHFTNLIDSNMSNIQLLNKLNNVIKQKNVIRNRIFETRSERNQVAVQVNSLRKQFIEMKNKYTLKKKLLNDLISLKQQKQHQRQGEKIGNFENGNGLMEVVDLKIDELRKVVGSGCGVVDKLHSVNSLLKSLEKTVDGN